MQQLQQMDAAAELCVLQLLEVCWALGAGMVINRESRLFASPAAANVHTADVQQNVLVSAVQLLAAGGELKKRS